MKKQIDLTPKKPKLAYVGMDKRDEAKKERAEEYVSMLTEADPEKEEWRYLFIREEQDKNSRDKDISWWENRSVLKVGDLYRYKNSI